MQDYLGILAKSIEYRSLRRRSVGRRGLDRIWRLPRAFGNPIDRSGGRFAM